jgi:hypothetical protein
VPPTRGRQPERAPVEEALAAVGLALLVVLFLNAVEVFQGNARVGVAAGIAGLGLYSPKWGWRAALAALAWPLWLLAPGLAMLCLPLALLLEKWITRLLPWVLLVALVPLLAQWHAVAVVPLLAGLLGGPRRGLILGIAAAFWLKIVGGLAGWVPELGALQGAPLAMDLIRSNLSGSSPVAVLQALVAPLTHGSLLPFHLLQVMAWGLAGWLAGSVRRIEWEEDEPRFALVPPLATSALALWGALYLLPIAFALESWNGLLGTPTLVVGIALSALTAALLTTLYESVQPLLPRRAALPPPTRPRIGREGPAESTIEEISL